ncbi:hypothetical protein VTH06DRAFT_1940 [Thermothelomyces fergusii]
MASSARNPRGTAAGRVLVFCYQCRNESYCRPDDLECPYCHSSFVEFAESLNDARDDVGGPTLASSLRGSSTYPRRPAASVLDPDEADTEEYLNPRQGHGLDDAGGNAPFEHLFEILATGFGAARVLRGGPLGDGLFPTEESLPRQGGTRIQQTTVRTGPFASHTSITITSGSTGGGSEMRDSPDGSPPHPVTFFDQLFGNPWRVGGPPEEFGRRERGSSGAAGFPLLGGLQELLNSLSNPANAVHGDAVFTQEALDRIITQLMEASPQTNAAPPASESAIRRLEKKKVDDEMLGSEGKAECTICIDEIKKGDEVTVLPCTHWYHGDCVVLWLKQHNTCPICRAPIENGNGGNSNNNNNNNNNNDNSSGSRTRRPSEQPPQHSDDRQSASAPFGSLFGNPLAPRTRPERERDWQRPYRSMQDDMERFNAFRNPAGAGPRSSSQRRSSHSPSGAFPASDFQYASRARVRSPSGSRDRARNWDGERDRVTERYTSPLDGWFGYGGGSYGESSRQPSPQSPQNQDQGNGQRGTLAWLRGQFGRRG